MPLLNYQWGDYEIQAPNIINPSHRLSAGLIRDIPINEGGGDIYDYVDGDFGDFNSTPSFYSAVWGEDEQGHYVLGTSSRYFSFSRRVSTIINKQFTVLCLFKPVTATFGEFCGEKDSFGDANWVLSTTTTKFRTRIHTSFRDSTSNITVGSWHVGGQTYDGSNFYTWLDGEQSAGTSYTGALEVHTDLVFKIGYIAGIAPNTRVGKVSIWDRVLSSSEIEEWSHNPYGMYNRIGHKTFGMPVSIFDLNKSGAVSGGDSNTNKLSYLALNSISMTSATLSSITLNPIGTELFSNWINSNWLTRKSWRISKSLVSGSNELIDFPVCLSVTDSDLTDARSDGFDIIITREDGVSRIPHEIERFDNSTGEIVLWFKTNLSPDNDVRGYIYLNNSSALDQQQKFDVWNSNYQNVIHLAETPSGADSIKDSTSHERHGTPNSSTQEDSKIGKGIIFDGTDDYISFGDTGVGDGYSKLTASCWVKRQDQSGANRDLLSKWATADYSFYIELNALSNQSNILFGFSATQAISTTGTPLTLGNWHYLVGVYDGSLENVDRAKLYIDGVRQAVSTFGTIPTVLGNSASGFDIGGNSSFAGQRYLGSLDEVRLLNNTLDIDWIKTEYNNQNSPTDFIMLSNKETLS